MADSPVLKAIAILRRLAEYGAPIGVQQVAADTGLNVSTVHRLLQLMASDGMITYDPHARVYGIGTECIRFATQVLGSGSLIGRIRPIIADLAASLGETCAFTIYEPREFSKVIAIVERGPQPLGYHFEVGTRDGIHAGASGKVILAFLDEADIERLLAKPLPRLTEHTVLSPEQLRRQIREIRKRGYAISRGERIPGGGTGIAAPVFGPRGQVVGSLVVTVPSFRLRNDRLVKTANTVMQCAHRVSGIFDPVLAQQTGSRR